MPNSHLIVGGVYGPGGWLVAVTEVAESHGQELATAVQVFETRSGQPLGRIPIHSVGPGDVPMVFAPGGGTLFLGDGDGLRAVDLATGRDKWRARVQQPWPVEAYPNAATVMTITRDGRLLATGHVDGSVLLWSLGEVLPQVTAEGRRLGVLWDDLKSEDAQRAQVAVEELKRCGDRGVDFVREKLAVHDTLTVEHARALIGRLDTAVYGDRQKAEKELLDLTERPRPFIVKELARTDISAEKRMRLDRVLAASDPRKPPSGELLRGVRAIQLLELVGTRRSKDLLHVIANDEQLPRQSLEAKEATERLKGSP